MVSESQRPLSVMRVEIFRTGALIVVGQHAPAVPDLTRSSSK